MDICQISMNIGKSWVMLIFLLILMGCANSSTSDSEKLPSLKDVYEEYFDIGAAVNDYQLQNFDSEALSLVEKQYNTVTPENLMKWENIHPMPDSFNVKAADRYINFGKENGMFIVGHTLVWHRQTPDWVFEDEEGRTLNRGDLLDRMEKHISAIAGRYRGQVDGWDVVNEVFNEDGSLRESPWYNIIGEDYIEKAFLFAHAADSSAELYYNDFNLWKPEKRDATVALVNDLQSNGVRIDGVGMQSHLGLENPSTDQVEESILAFSELGVDVMISELDINVSRYVIENEIEIQNELPDSLQQRLTSRYVELFELFKKHSDKITRVTFWGVNDGQSWLNYWEDYEIDNHPLLFDRQNEPKPAFHGVIGVAKD